MNRASRPRRRPRPGPLAPAALGALVACAGAAHANPYSVHAEGAVSVGWTDNAANRAEVATEVGRTVPESGFFTQLRPAALLSYEARRSVHVSAASLDINLYGTQEPSNSYNGSFNHDSRFTVSSLTELGLGASLGFGRVDPLNTGQTAEIQGDTTFVSMGASETARHQLTKDLQVNQGLGYSFVRTTSSQVVDDQPVDVVSDAHNVTLSVGLDRAWERMALGGSAGVSYANLAGGETEQIITNLSATGRYDISPLWTSAASLGVSAITTVSSTVESSEETAFTPTGLLSVSYLQQVGSVIATLSASLSHSVTPNLLLGNITNTTTAAFNASLPLPWLRRGQDTTLQASGTLSLSHAQPTNVTSDAPPNWNNYAADAVLNWRFLEEASLALRYQYVRTDVFNYDATDMAILVQPPEDFFRHTVLVEVQARFPARQAVEIPRRRMLRVDEWEVGQESPNARRRE